MLVGRRRHRRLLLLNMVLLRARPSFSIRLADTSLGLMRQMRVNPYSHSQVCLNLGPKRGDWRAHKYRQTDGQTRSLTHALAIPSRDGSLHVALVMPCQRKNSFIGQGGAQREQCCSRTSISAGVSCEPVQLGAGAND